MKTFKDFIIRIAHSGAFYSISRVMSKICLCFLLFVLIAFWINKHFFERLTPFAFLAIGVLFCIDFLNIFKLHPKEVIIKNSILIVILANANSWFWMFYIIAIIIYCFFPHSFNYIICSIIFIVLIIFADKISEIFYKKLSRWSFSTSEHHWCFFV